jgi:hypothetical protein
MRWSLFKLPPNSLVLNVTRVVPAVTEITNIRIKFLSLESAQVRNRQRGSLREHPIKRIKIRRRREV